MADLSEEQQILISGYLDGELDAEARRRMEALLRADPAFRREFDSMKTLVVGTTEAFRMDEPPEEVWDTFIDHVYNRIERKTGWVVLIAGSIGLALYGLYAFIVYDWGSALTKSGIAAVAIGAVILFISVLRQRLEAARTDRYSREVHR
jgi:anti-sigma factor RsiW